MEPHERQLPQLPEYEGVGRYGEELRNPDRYRFWEESAHSASALPEPHYPRSYLGPPPRQVSSEHVGEQIRPVMATARHIVENYKPLSGDIMESWHEDPESDDMSEEVQEEVYESNPDFWARKAHEAKTGTRAEIEDMIESEGGSDYLRSTDYGQELLGMREDYKPIAESIDKEGVRDPVSLAKQGNEPEVLGGHHRVAHMYATNPDKLMPVYHTSDSWSARQELGGRY